MNYNMTKEVLRPKRMNDQGDERSILWSDIKEFVNSLTDEKLQQEVIVWGEEKGGGITSIVITEDDLINPSGEGVEPISVYSNSENEEDRKIAEEETIVMTKGTLVLELNF